MTQSVQMPVLLTLALLLMAPPLLTFPARAQDGTGEFEVDRAHPRLLLTPRRTRLLRREHERQSLRWVQFEALMRANRGMPEPGFAGALYYVASGSEAHGRQAVEWALREGDGDLRQLALVFDWCQNLLSEGERERLVAGLKRGLERSAEKRSFPAIRSRAMAAVALAEEAGGSASEEMRWLVEEWWRGEVIPSILRGEYVIPRESVYPLAEILHVVRYNLHLDLRFDARDYFISLPLYLLLSSYPAVYPAAENEFHIPVRRDGDEPDLKEAILARAADLSLVAYDANAEETQYLQGWSMLDRFLMRSARGIPYEFLWANPYHPGLSFYSAPLTLYDENSGRLLARSSWDGDAVWFYYEDGVMQTFEGGRIQPLRPDAFEEPLTVGDLVVQPMWKVDRFPVRTETPVTYYLIGLEPGASYDIEIDDEELYEETADRGGLLVMSFPPGRVAGVRLSKSPR